MKNIGIVVTPGCWAMSLFAVTDFFRIVSLLEKQTGLAAGYRVHLLANAADTRLDAAGGIAIETDSPLEEARPVDWLIFPAIEGPVLEHTPSPPRRALAYLARHCEAKRVVLTLSTGIVPLAATGLVNGLRINTHWAFLPTLQQRYTECHFRARESYLQDRWLYSTGSLHGSFDALLALLANDRGDHFAQLCAAHLLVSSPIQMRPVLPGTRRHDDAAILAVQEWLESNPQASMSLEQLASRFGFSERNLKRRFTLATGLAPHLYLQKVRIDRAKKLLISGALSVQQIAHQVGYENVSYFIRLFQREAGDTPAQWRKTNGAY